jgi:phosphate-selective porin
MKLVICIGLFALCSSPLWSQGAWYERLSLRGYTQVRFVETHQRSAESIWTSGGLSIRRGRLILSGFASDRVFIYIQPDFAATFGSSLNVMQLRDAYFDVFIDSLHTWRVRIGQSKVPFGYENMQSSSLRLPMERAEALNNASVPGERDIGVFVMWAPTYARSVYARLAREGKGSGDYGCLSVGVYNGQGINKPELNRTLSWNARATYPIEIAGSVIEPALHAYVGRYVPQVGASVQQTSGDYRDERYAVSLAVSPAPIGLLAEWAWGHAPRYQAPTNGGGGTIQSGRIEGGFVTVYATARVGDMQLAPFVRWQTMHGGNKSALDAPMTDLAQWEAGVEWQLSRQLELTLEYMQTDRTALSSSGAQRSRNEAVWLQLQINY